MRYWDSSAIVPLIVRERVSAEAEGMLTEDGDVVAWWATSVECVSALVRREREGTLSPSDLGAAMALLTTLQTRWIEIEAGERVRTTAQRLLRVHVLRAADALQLAAALIACEAEPATLDFVCFDRRLCVAAEREGFTIRPASMLSDEP